MRRHTLAAAGILALALTGISASVAAANPGCPQGLSSRCLYAPVTPSTELSRLASVANIRVPTVAVEAKRLGYYLNVPQVRYFVSQGLALHVTGANFPEGQKVSVAVMDTSEWRMLYRGSVFAQPALVASECPSGHFGCPEPNPAARTIDYRIRLSGLTSASNLELVYRWAGHSSMQGVTLK